MGGALVFPPVEALFFVGYNMHHTKCKCSKCTDAVPTDVILERVELFEGRGEQEADNQETSTEGEHAKATDGEPKPARSYTPVPRPDKNTEGSRQLPTTVSRSWNNFEDLEDLMWIGTFGESVALPDEGKRPRAVDEGRTITPGLTEQQMIDNVRRTQL